ncbi:MAG: RDD family protein [Magnetospirillum sp.]|nr:MAG: RDD family protein [Magnetospirillum sp.]
MRQSVATIEHCPEWGDPWGHPRYYLGITARRVYAYLLDIVVVGLLSGMAFVASVILGALTLGLLWPLLMVVLGLVPILYHTLAIGGPRSATLGMRVAGIKVMSIAPGAEQDGGRPTLLQAMIQTIGFYGSIAITCTLILLVALFNPRRRTLHDFLAGTVVVNDPAQWGGPGNR